MEPIILASSSPRRQEILRMLKVPFRVINPNIDETVITAVETEQIPELIARQKITEVIHTLPPKQEIPWILAADTIVTYGGKIYGKPQSAEQAVEYLKLFQGSTHQTITAIALYNGRKKEITTRINKTYVTFAPMTDEEIQWYVDTGEWHGAAGGYRIQSLASIFIKKIEGSYSNVIGLPIFELYDILKEQGYSLLE